MKKPRFPVGTRVQTTMGCRLNGVVVSRFPWRESTDGTYREHGADYLAVKWDDGTKGYSYEYHIEKEKIHA